MNPLELARARPGEAFTVTFDGRPLTVLPGQTAAAALWAAGVTAWRSPAAPAGRAASSAGSGCASTAW